MCKRSWPDVNAQSEKYKRLWVLQQPCGAQVRDGAGALTICRLLEPEMSRQHLKGSVGLPTQQVDPLPVHGERFSAKQ